MRMALSHLWVFLSALFRGGAEFAQAFEQVGAWAHDEARAFRTEADVEREIKLAERRKARLALEQQQQ